MARTKRILKVDLGSSTYKALKNYSIELELSMSEIMRIILESQLPNLIDTMMQLKAAGKIRMLKQMDLIKSNLH